MTDNGRRLAELFAAGVERPRVRARARQSAAANDTHPALAVPELMRILLDQAYLGWDEAWDLSRRSLADTNHTLLPEALEKWSLPWFEMLLPHQLEIILEINRRLLDETRTRFPGDSGRVEPVFRRRSSGPTCRMRPFEPSS